MVGNRPLHIGSRRSVYKAMRGIVVDINAEMQTEGLPQWTPYTPYSLRHTCATRWREMGIEYKVIAKWLGNSKEITSRIYTHVREHYEMTDGCQQ